MEEPGSGSCGPFNSRMSLPFCSLVSAVVAVALLLTIGVSGALASAPVNDNFANATVLSGTNPGASGTLTDSTLESGEYSWLGMGLEQGSVWYRWTAPSTGDLEFVSLTGPYYVDIQTGSSVNNTQGLWMSAFSGTTHEVTAGVEYRFRVFRVDANTAGQNFQF